MSHFIGEGIIELAGDCAGFGNFFGLETLALEACAKLDAVDAAKAVAAMKSVVVQIGTAWSDAGTSMDYRGAKDLFPSAAAWKAALEARTREAKTTAVALLSELDAAAAAELFRKVAWLKTENAIQISYETR